eukprot:32402-Pleurochrysis_carterae.AAC.1
MLIEAIWAVSPSSFLPSQPLGPYFRIDPNNRDIQRYSFVFSETGAKIEWCAVFVPAEQREVIRQLHCEAALLLADR